MSQEKLESAKNWFFIALGIDIAVTALVIMANVWAIGVLNDIRSGASTASQSTISTLGFWEGFSQLTILTMIGVGFGLVKWLKSSYHFAKDSLGATGFKNEGWTWAGWIIPILNVFKPYQIISEIYKAGAPTYTTSDGWKKESGSSLLLTWWIFWVITHLIVAIIGKEYLRSPMHDDVTLQQALSMTSLQVWACVISIIIASLWFVVAGNLTRRLLARSAPVLASIAPNHSSAPYVPIVPMATDFPGTTPTWVNTNNQATVAQTSDHIQEASMDNFEDRVYAEIAKELEDGVADKGLWTRLFAECGGDEKQTKVFYIKQRAEKLISVERDRLEQESSELAAEVARIEVARLEQLRGTADAKLAAAVSDGNWALASRLLREGIKPDGFDETGNSLLDLARKRNDRQLIILLESYGAGQV